MQSSALKYAIWLTHFILIFSSVGCVVFLAAGFYSAYDYNSLMKIEELNLELGDSPDKLIVQLSIGFGVLISVVSIYTFNLVRQVLIRIRSIGPFDLLIVSNLRRILKGSIFMILLSGGITFIRELSEGRISFGFDSSSLIIVFLISIVYVMIEILKHGIMIREEQRLTI